MYTWSLSLSTLWVEVQTITRSRSLPLEREIHKYLLCAPPPPPRFGIKKFHHVEFYCGDATAATSHFANGLGMNLVAKSDLVRSCAVALCSVVGTFKVSRAPAGLFSATNTIALWIEIAKNNAS